MSQHRSAERVESRAVRIARSLLGEMNQRVQDSRARFAWWCGGGMALVIVGTLFWGAGVALSSMAILVLAVSWTSLRKPFVSIAIFFIYLAMEGMYKYLTTFSKWVYVARPLMLAILTGFWLFGYHRQRVLRCEPFGTFAIPGLAIWGAICLFNPYGGEFVAGVATYLLFYGTPMCLFYVVSRGDMRRSDLMLILFLLLSVSTIVSGFTVLQYIKGMDWTIAHLPGYDFMPLDQATWFIFDEAGNVTGGFRPASTTSSGGGGALWSSIGVIVGFGLLHLPLPVKRRRVVHLAVLVCGLGLILSGVRIWSFVTLAGVFLFTLLVGKHVLGFGRSLGLLGGFVLVTLAAFGGALLISEGTIQKRYADTFRNPVARFRTERAGNLVVFARLAWTYPLGSGYHVPLGYQGIAMRDAGMADPVMQARTGETQFGAVTGDMGVPGLLLLAGIYLNALIMGWRTVHRLRNASLRVIGAMMFAVIASYFPGWFGGPILQGNLLFWFAAAVLLTLPGLEILERQEWESLLSRVRERVSDGAQAEEGRI